MLFERLKKIDPSTWILLFAVLIRIDVVLRFAAVHGYDSHAHFRYTELLSLGEIPRVGVNTWASQHPPLYYLIALALEKIGIGHEGGKFISLAAGVARLFIADRIFRRLEFAPHQRLIANTIHAFIPVGIRMDAFYSPESLAATLCLAAVWVALKRSPIAAGIVLGAALLAKATAVVTIPAVAHALTLARDGNKLTREGIKRGAIAMVIAGSLTMLWAAGNIQKFGTPYPNAYRVQNDEVWKRPLFARHGPQYYFPSFVYENLFYPFYVSPPLSMPNVLVIDAWGDYYNFLNRGLSHDKPKLEQANGRELGVPRLRIHVVLAHLGIIFTLILIAGGLGAVKRFFKKEMPPEEVAIAILGAGYVFIMVWYAIWVPHEQDGPAKAAYGLGASAILSWWTARPLARIAARGTAARVAVTVLVAAPVMLAVLLRIVW